MAGIEIEGFRDAVRAGRVDWLKHALERMILRGISRAEVLQIMQLADRVEDYPEARPLPCALFLGEPGARPLHVVAAFDSASKRVAVITAYEPTLEEFEPGFRKRRKA
jgi:hypothetical protein